MTTETTALKQANSEETTRAGRTFSPLVNISETPDAIWLSADMPGVDEAGVDVRFDDGVLSIEGHVDVEEYKHLTPVSTEYNVGNYMRRFRLSDRIDVDRIRAKMAEGVLQLELPKADHAKTREIQVTAG